MGPKGKEEKDHRYWQTQIPQGCIQEIQERFPVRILPLSIKQSLMTPMLRENTVAKKRVKKTENA
jgi:hypothetical protein